MKQWLNEWMKLFNNARTYKINEVAETRSLKDFLLAIDLINSEFNSVHMTDFLNTVYSTITIEQMFTLIQKFRHIIRIRKENKVSSRSHFAFFVDENSTSTFLSSSSSRSKEENKCSSFREKSIESFQCTCEEKH